MFGRKARGKKIVIWVASELEAAVHTSAFLSLRIPLLRQGLYEPYDSLFHLYSVFGLLRTCFRSSDWDGLVLSYCI